MKEFYKWSFDTYTPAYIGTIVVLLHIFAALFYVILAVYLGSVAMLLLIPAGMIYVVFMGWKKHKGEKDQ